MTVFVDNVQIPWRGRTWCHLVADDLAELHAFAARLGLLRRWFQDSASYPHYDVTAETRLKALAFGAIQGSRAQMISCAKKLKTELEQEEALTAYDLQLSLL